MENYKFIILLLGKYQALLPINKIRSISREIRITDENNYFIYIYYSTIPKNQIIYTIVKKNKKLT